MTKRKRKPKLTDREQDILDVIKMFIKGNGYSPSHREIGELLVPPINKVTVATHLQHMREKVAVEWKDRSPRTLRIL